MAASAPTTSRAVAIVAVDAGAPAPSAPRAARWARIVSSSSVTGWIRMRTPAAARVAASSIGERPPSTALYSSGVPARALGDAGELLDVLDRLDEHDVGPGVDEPPRPLDRLVDAGDGDGVGPGDDDGVRRAARLDGDGDALDGVGEGDDLLVLEVAAALRRDLVLDLHGRRAGRLDLDDGAPHVQRAAEAGVDVGDDRDVDARRDPAHGRGDVVEAEQAEVGDAQRRRREGEPGQVGGVEAGLLDERGAEGVEAPGGVDEAPRRPSARAVAVRTPSADASALC